MRASPIGRCNVGLRFMNATGLPARPASRRLPERTLRRARLVSGLVLLAFTAMHLLNHTLLLVSVPSADAARPLFLAIWRNPLGTVLLYGAASMHFFLAMLALYRRRTLVMPAREALQIGLGLAIPVLLAEHVIGTRVYEALTGVKVDYEFVLRSLWVFSPIAGVRQTIALMAVWAHGCIGLYFWIRYRPWYPRAAPWLLIVAVVVAGRALLGFAGGGRLGGAPQPPPPTGGRGGLPGGVGRPGETNEGALPPAVAR